MKIKKKRVNNIKNILDIFQIYSDEFVGDIC